MQLVLGMSGHFVISARLRFEQCHPLLNDRRDAIESATSLADAMDLPVPLPPTEIRQAGGRLRFDDDYFVDAALYDASLLKSVGLSRGMHLVDFGCGPGRVAIGLILSDWAGSYLGVEVNERHTRWTSANITTQVPEFQFVRVDATHARYNPKGSDSRRLPVADASVDFICAFSVFSHMLSDDTTVYLTEFCRALTSDGKAFITAFMSDGVPDETENPPWIRDWSGRLHGVLYSTNHLSHLIGNAGMTLEEVVEMDGREQIGLLLSPSQTT